MIQALGQVSIGVDVIFLAYQPGFFIESLDDSRSVLVDRYRLIRTLRLVGLIASLSQPRQFSGSLNQWRDVYPQHPSGLRSAAHIETPLQVVSMDLPLRLDNYPERRP